METPPSMRDELASWNNGNGIDLANYVSCMGDFRLAVGYCTLFWPPLALVEGYILREGWSPEELRPWENGKRSRADVERLLNHEHIGTLHSSEHASKDKLVVLGRVMKEILTAKLAWQFPDYPCRVEFYVPEDADHLEGYQVTFWQPRNEMLITPTHVG